MASSNGGVNSISQPRRKRGGEVAKMSPASESHHLENGMAKCESIIENGSNGGS